MIVSTDLICTIDDLGVIGIGLGTGLLVGLGVTGFLVSCLEGFIVCGGVGLIVGCLEGLLDGGLLGLCVKGSKFSCSSSGRFNSIIDSSTLEKVRVGF